MVALDDESGQYDTGESDLKPEKERRKERVYDKGASLNLDHCSRYMALGIMKNEQYTHKNNYHQF